MTPAAILPSDLLSKVGLEDISAPVSHIGCSGTRTRAKTCAQPFDWRNLGAVVVRRSVSGTLLTRFLAIGNPVGVSDWGRWREGKNTDRVF